MTDLNKNSKKDSASFIARLLTVENVGMLIFYSCMLTWNWASLSAQVEAAQHEVAQTNKVIDRVLTKLEKREDLNSITFSRLATIEADLKWIRQRLE